MSDPSSRGEVQGVFVSDKLVHHPWSNTSFFLGIVISLHSWVIPDLYKLWRRTKSAYYRFVLCLPFAGMLNILSGWLANYYLSLSNPPNTLIIALLALSDLAALIFDGGFLTINVLRLWNTCRKNNPKMCRICAVLAACSVTATTIGGISNLVLHLGGSTQESSDLTYQIYVFNFGLSETVLHFTISTTFIMYLQSLAVDKGFTVRPHLVRLLRRAQLMLMAEFTLVLSVAGVEGLTSDDPLYGLYYLSEGIRIRVFGQFLLSLNEVLRKHPTKGRRRSTRAIISKSTCPRTPADEPE